MSACRCACAAARDAWSRAHAQARSRRCGDGGAGCRRCDRARRGRSIARLSQTVTARASALRARSGLRGSSSARCTADRSRLRGSSPTRCTASRSTHRRSGTTGCAAGGSSHRRPRDRGSGRRARDRGRGTRAANSQSRPCGRGRRACARCHASPTARGPRRSGDFAGGVGTRLFPQREILNADVRLLRPLPTRMLRNKFSIRINRVGAASTLPIPVFAKLSNARARLRHELTLWMPLYKLPVAVDGVGRLRGAPILLLAAAPRSQQHQTQTNRSTSCPDCDHRQHLPLAATGYCNDALTEQGPHRVPRSNDERYAEATFD